MGKKKGITYTAAIGYMLLAARASKLDKETTKKLEDNMKYLMEGFNEQAAEFADEGIL